MRRFCSMLSMLLLSGAVHASEIDFDIAAQPLASALAAYARQADLQVLFPQETVRDRIGNAVRGRLDRETALSILLDKTGLQASFAPNGTVLVKTAEVSGQTGAAVHTAGLRLVDAHASSQSEDDAEAPAASRPLERGAGEEIVVTGSRLKQTESTGTAPVVVFDRDTIDRSNATSLQQLLHYLPQASVNNDVSGFSSFAGASIVRLRGLAAGTTLVLINGRRVAASGAQFGSAAFDLNNIPVAAVERVEVLTDSASAIYGADAIAGVVNVILRHGSDGSSVEARYGAATEGGLDEKRLSFTVGMQNDRLQTMLVLDGSDTSPLFGSDRDRTANADYTRYGGPNLQYPLSNPGNVYALAGSGNLPGLSSTFAAVPRGSSGVLTPQDFAATAGTLNGSGLFAGNSFRGDIQAVGGMGVLEVALNEHAAVFAQALYRRRDEVSYHTSNFIFGGGWLGYEFAQVPADNPFNPFGVPVVVDYAFPSMGRNDQESRFLRALAGIKGRIGSRLDWEVGVLRTTDKMESVERGAYDAVKVQEALIATDPALALNVFQEGPPASPEVLASLLAPPVTASYENKGLQFDAQLRGSVPWQGFGSIDAVAGMERRREKFSARDAFLIPAADRTVTSGYVEVSLPLLREDWRLPLVQRLIFTPAIRRDRYDDFGSSTNPQLGLKWVLGAAAFVRATRGRAFRAPLLQQLYTPPSEYQVQLSDARRGGDLYSVPIQTGGNRNLEPERGRSTSLGLVLTPTQWGESTVSVDFWRLTQSSRIQLMDRDIILQNEELFADRIQRAAPSPADQAAGIPGRIELLDISYLNFGRLDLRGIDLRAEHSRDWLGGKGRIGIAATYVDRYRAALLPGLPARDRAGIADLDGFAPKWKGNVQLGWANENWDLSSALRYIHSYRDYESIFAGFLNCCTAPREVGTQSLVDARLAYSFAEGGAVTDALRIAVGVTNLFDRAPPYSNSQTGYDPLQGDLIGRFVYLNLSKDF